MAVDVEKLEKDVKKLQEQVYKISSLTNAGKFSDRVVFDRRLFIKEHPTVPTVFGEAELINANGKLLMARNGSYLITAGVGVRDIAAGTAADTPTLADTLIRMSTSVGQALTVTLPEAANSLGLLLAFTFVTDGGQNITINRAGADTIDDSGDVGNTAITLDSAGDTIVIMAVQDNIWMVLNNIACVLS